MNSAATPTSLPSAAEIEIARESSRNLAVALASRAETQQFDFKDDKGEQRSVMLPTSALKLLVEVLAEIGARQRCSIIPIHAELTTQEAADLAQCLAPIPGAVARKGRHTVPPHQYPSPCSLSGRARLQEADRRRAFKRAR